MPGTRSHNEPLEEFVDDPEKLRRIKRKSNMAYQPNNRAVVPNCAENKGEVAQLNISVETATPPPDYYLPDMEHTHISECQEKSHPVGPQPV